MKTWAHLSSLSYDTLGDSEQSVMKVATLASEVGALLEIVIAMNALFLYALFLI